MYNHNFTLLWFVTFATQENAKAKHDTIQAQSNLERVNHANWNLELDRCARGDFSVFLRDNFTPDEIKKITVTQVSLFDSVTAVCARWHDRYKGEVGNAYAKGKELDKAKDIIKSLLERCAHRVNLDDIEGLSSYRL